MPRFAYMVQDPGSNVLSGMLDASDMDQLVRTLQRTGNVVLSVKPARPPSAGRIGLGRFGRIGNRELVFFAEQLATLLEGGVPLARALSLQAKQTANPAMESVLQRVCQNICNGKTLSQALAAHPEVFSLLWVGMIRAGEVSGRLQEALLKLAAYIEFQGDLRAKVVTALTYPAILMALSVVAVAFFVVRVVPVFADIFTSFNLRLPWSTQAVLSASSALSSNPEVWVGAVAAALAVGRLYLATEAGRLEFNHFLFGLPVFGPLARQIQLQRLLNTLSLQVASGVNILESLEVLEGVAASSPLLRNALRQIRKEVASGTNLSEAVKKSGEFPQLVVEMTAMGEESGKLQKSLETLSRYYAKQIDQFIRRLSSMVDPILVVFVGGIVGFIVLSVFAPIFQLSQIR